MSIDEMRKHSLMTRMSMGEGRIRIRIRIRDRIRIRISQDSEVARDLSQKRRGR